MKILKVLMVSLLSVMIMACTDAEVVNRNIDKASDLFEIPRRIVFYNGITDQYMFEITGLCSLDVRSDDLRVTCKDGEGEYKRHYLGLSDNVTYFVEHLDGGPNINNMRYRVIFKPSVLVPSPELVLE